MGRHSRHCRAAASHSSKHGPTRPLPQAAAPHLLPDLRQHGRRHAVVEQLAIQVVELVLEDAGHKAAAGGMGGEGGLAGGWERRQGCVPGRTRRSNTAAAPPAIACWPGASHALLPAQCAHLRLRVKVLPVMSCALTRTREGRCRGGACAGWVEGQSGRVLNATARNRRACQNKLVLHQAS